MKSFFLSFFLLVQLYAFAQPQYASSVISFSSQYSTPNYSASKALGSPDVPSCSDNANAWASLTADGQREFLELGFATSQPVNSIKIYQSYNPGAVDTVYIRNASNGNWTTVYTATATPTACINVLSIPIITTAYNVDAIRIAVNSTAISGWNEIDAVSIENRISNSLLINGSAEDDAPLAYGWTAVGQPTNCSGVGLWRIAGDQGGYPLAKEGTYIFFPGCYSGGDEVYELYQDINLAAFTNDIDLGLQSFIFKGYVRSFDQLPRDSTQIIVEYRDIANNILATYNTGFNGNVSEWDLKTDTRVAPIGTRTVRVRLISHHFNANSVDSYFDDLSFNPLAVPIISLCGPVANTTISSNITGSTYQWQLNTGSGFADINNNSNYSGTNTGTLQITNPPSSWYGYQYRCIVNGNTSSTRAIKFVHNWTGAGNDNLWENIANWGCNSIPDAFTDVIINSGTVTVNSNASCRSILTGNTVNLTVKPAFKLLISH